MATRLEKVRLTIDGDGLRPAAIPIRDLTALLTRYQSLLRAAAEESGVKNAKRTSIRLTGIRKGSVALVLLAARETLRVALPAIHRRIRDRIRFSSSKTEAYYRSLLRFLVRSNWELETVPTNGQPFRIAAEDDTDDQMLVGGTTLYGTCLSVGGDHPTAQLRIDGQQPLVRVRLSSKEQAKVLAGALYGPVGVTGIARWNAADDRVFSIDAEDVFAFHNDSPAMTINALRTIAGPSWDAIADPDAFLRELRRD